jgi:hypothetical protein
MKPVHEWQRGLQYFNGCLFVPNSTDGFGAFDKWTTGAGTISHATVGTAFDTQFKRTIYTQVVTTANQELGPRKSNTGDYQFWLGDKRFCGGFYFSTVFRIEAWNNDGGRLFIGLTAGANSNAISDTLQNNSMGVFHKHTDGANILNFVTRDNAGSEKTQVVADATHAVGALTAGNTLLWEMWHYPNAISPASAGLTGITVNWKLSIFDTTNGTDGRPLNRVKLMTYNENNFTTNPTTTMFAPQVQMSNGSTDATAGHFSIGVANVYVAPWSGEMD